MWDHAGCVDARARFAELLFSRMEFSQFALDEYPSDDMEMMALSEGFRCQFQEEKATCGVMFSPGGGELVSDSS